MRSGSSRSSSSTGTPKPTTRPPGVSPRGGWTTSTGWALSDSLAAGPVARMVADDPRRFSQLLRWTRSRNMWRRHAAAYALHDLVLGGDLDRPLSLLERLVRDPEFWVQRAVGTWLRECWKRDPVRYRPGSSPGRSSSRSSNDHGRHRAGAEVLPQKTPSGPVGGKRPCSYPHQAMTGVEGRDAAALGREQATQLLRRDRKGTAPPPTKDRVDWT